MPKRPDTTQPTDTSELSEEQREQINDLSGLRLRNWWAENCPGGPGKKNVK